MSSAVMWRGLSCSSSSRMRMRGCVILRPALHRSWFSIVAPLVRPRGLPGDLQCIIDAFCALRVPMRKFLLVAILAAATAGCGILYKQPIYQGNLIEKTAADQLQVGMSKQQVETLLGTPSIQDPFHHNRWDYAASERTNRRGTVEVKNLTLWFENEALAKWEGDYFPEQDDELSKKMSHFGNLAKDKKKHH